MKQRLYIDTSVFGGFYDSEFEEFTKPLLVRIKNKDLKIIYSSVTEEEIAGAPERVKELIKGLPADIFDFVEVTDEAVELAMTYIS